MQMVYFRLVLFLLCVVWKVFHGQPMQQPPPSAPHQPTSIRPRVRARRGQATDPHSIAERVYFRFSFVFPCDILCWWRVGCS